MVGAIEALDSSTALGMTWEVRSVGGTGVGWLNVIQIPAFAGMTSEGRE